MDFDAPPKPKAKKEETSSFDLDFNFDQAPEKRIEPKRPTIRGAKERSPEFETMLHKIQKFCAKQRQSILIHICLVCLAYKMCKFYIVKDILSKDDILKVLAIQVDGLESLTKSCQD